MSANTYQNTRRNIPEDSHLHMFAYLHRHLEWILRKTQGIAMEFTDLQNRELNKMFELISSGIS
jgi:hypothetical protein